MPPLLADVVVWIALVYLHQNILFPTELTATVQYAIDSACLWKEFGVLSWSPLHRRPSPCY